MSTITTTINSEAWTTIANFSGVLAQHISITREEQVDFEIAYDPNPTTPICKVTTSCLGVETKHIPSGGKIYAKTLSGTATIVLNWK